MTKYIPADKLIAEIERLAKSYQDPTFITVRGNTANNFRDNLLAFITALQQEQSEVEFEKTYKSYMKSRKDDLSGNAVTLNMKDLARHFYELGCSTQYQKDRGEFAKLKAKEWQEGYDEGYAKGLNARKKEE